MLTVFTLVLGYNLKVAVGTSTMIMSLVALTGAVSHVSLGAQLFPLPMAIVVASCLLGRSSPQNLPTVVRSGA